MGAPLKVHPSQKTAPSPGPEDLTTYAGQTERRRRLLREAYACGCGGVEHFWHEFDCTTVDSWSRPRSWNALA